MKKIRKICALVIIGLLVGVNFAIVVNMMANDEEPEYHMVFVEDRKGNRIGDYSLEKRDDDKYDMDIWTDFGAWIEIKGLTEPPQDLLVKIDSDENDLCVEYVVYIDPIEMDRAFVTLPRNRAILKILHGPTFDPHLFKCDDWETTDIPFTERSKSVTFEVEHFSAYGVAEKPDVYTVTTTADSGAGSLRQAIIDANADFGLDKIDFDIPGDDNGHYYYKDDGVTGQVTLGNRKTTTSSSDSSISDIDSDYPYSWWSISPTSPLPIITDPVIIDGYTQQGAQKSTLAQGNNARLRIELDGSNVGLYPGGLHIQGGSSVVRGLVIQGFDLCGIQIETNGNNVIEGNYIGTDVSGNEALGNFIGVNIYKSSDNRIGGKESAAGNIISNNLLLGVFISGDEALNNEVTGNYIGCGAVDVGNVIPGIWISDSVISDNLIEDNLNIDDVNKQDLPQLVIFDPSVEDYMDLMDGLLSPDDPTSMGYCANVEVVILDRNSDGIEQITEVLADYNDISGIHIISHGSMGSLSLGDTELNTDNLDGYAEEIEDWRGTLIDGADILLYGCNVAKGKEGVDFVEELSELTGADIAASNDPTGSAKLGGDWELEVSTGTIETRIPFSASVMDSYDHLLGEDIFLNMSVANYTSDPIITALIKEILVNGLGELATKLGEISTTDKLTDKFLEAIPGLLDISDPENPFAPGLGELFEDITLGDLFQIHLVNEILNNFTVPPNQTASQLVSFLSGLGPFTVGDLTVSIVSVSKSVVPAGGSKYQLRFDLTFKVEQPNSTGDVTFNLGRNADLLGMDYDPETMPPIDFQTGFILDLTFGTILDVTAVDYDGGGVANDTKVVANNDSFFVRDTTLIANATINESNINFDIQVGFLEIKVIGGNFSLDVDVKAKFKDPSSGNLINLTELKDTSAENLVTVSAKGSLFSFLPVEVKDIATIGFNSSLNALSLSIHLYGDPFDKFMAPDESDDPRTAPLINVSDAFEEHLLPFNNILSDGFLGLMGQLKGWLGSFGASQLFNAVDVPFADGKTLADVLGFASGLGKLLDDQNISLTDELGVTTPQFTSVQTLAVALDNALADMNLGQINPNYDLNTHELTFRIEINLTLPDILDVPIDFDLDLGPLGSIQTNVEVSLKPSIGFGFTVGIDLGTFKSLDTEIGVSSEQADFGLRALIDPSTGSTFTPSNGTLPRDANFRLILGGIGSVDVNVTADNTSNNNNINDLVQDIEESISTALAAEENISAEIQVEVLTGNRLGFFTTNTTFLKILNNSADENESAGGFELLGFADGQLGTISPLPQNGVLTGTASFDLTVGAVRYSITVDQDTDNANDTEDPIEELLLDIQAAINSTVGGDNIVNLRRISDFGDSFVLYLGNQTEEKFLRVDNPNEISIKELGVPKNELSAELTILGDRTLNITASTNLSSEIVSNGRLKHDVKMTLTVDDDPVTFTVRAANGKLLGFVCNQAANGTLTAKNNLTNPAPGADVTFKLTLGEDYYIVTIPETDTQDNVNIFDMINDTNKAFENVIAENGSQVNITSLVTAGKHYSPGVNKITLTPDPITTYISVTGMGTTQDNNNTLDLVDDINEAFGREEFSDGTQLDRVVVASLTNETDKFYLKLSVPSALKDWLNITYVSSSDLGFEVTEAEVFGPRANGHLSGNAVLNLSVDNGTSEIYTVTVLASLTNSNNNITDLVDDINSALESVTPSGGGTVNLSAMVIAGLLGNRIKLCAINKSIEVFEVIGVNLQAQNELGLDDGVTATTREPRGRLFIRDASLYGAVDLIVNTTDEPALSAHFGFVGIKINTIKGSLEGYGDDVAVHGGVTVSLGGIISKELSNFTLPGPENATFEMTYGDDTWPVTLNWQTTQSNTNINDLVTDLQNAIDSTPLNGKVTVGNSGNKLTLSTSAGQKLRLVIPDSETNPAATVLGFATGQQTGRIYLPDLAKAVTNLSMLKALVNLDISGSGNLTLSNISLQLPDAVEGLANELLGDPRIVIVLEDFTNMSTLNVTGLDMGAIVDGFDDLNFSSVLSALRSIYNLLTNFSKYDFYDEPIPILGVTLNETLNFIEPFLLAIEELSGENASIVQELTTLLKEVLGLPTDGDSVILSVLKGSTILRFNITWDESYSASLPVQIDLLNLLNINLPSSLQDIVNLSGAAGLEAEFSVEVTLGMGIDLSNLTIYIYDNTAVRLQGYANASNVNFMASLGSFGLFVTGGHAVFNEDGDPNNTNPAFLTLTAFDDPNPGIDGDKIKLFDIDNWTLRASLEAGIGAILPCYYPTASFFIGNLDFNISIGIDLSTTNDPFDLVVNATVREYPDFTKLPDLGDLNLIDSLLLAVEGLDLLLAILQTVLSGEFLGISIPLIGDDLAEAAEFIEDVRGSVIPKLRDFIENAPQKAIEFVQKAIYNALGPDGLNVLIVDADWDNNATKDYRDVQYVFDGNELQFNLWLGGWFNFTIPEFDFGLPGLGLDMDGGITLALNWNMLLCFGLSLDDGFYFDTTPWDEFTDHPGGSQKTPQIDGENMTHMFEISLGVILMEKLTGELLFLQLEVENRDVTMAEPDLKSLEAFFAVDVKGGGTDERLSLTEIPSISLNFSYGAEADLDLNLTLGVVGGDVWPSIQAEFYLRWGLGDSINNDSANPMENHYRIPWINFSNVRLNLGKYFSEFLAPILKEIKRVTEPLQDLIDILTSPIPVISDLAGKDITLIDIAEMFGVVDAGFIYALADLITLINSIPTDAEDIVIHFGSFSLGGDGTLDLRDPKALDEIRSASSSTPLGDILGSEDFGELLNTLKNFDFDSLLDDALSGSSSSPATKSFAKTMTKEGGGWSFPIFTDPGQLFGLLLGRPADIIVYDMPKFTFEFTYTQFFPIWDGLGAEISGTLGVKIDLSFGYDTYGLQEFAKGGFKHPLDLLKGFYVGDTDRETGVDIPEVTLYGSLTGACVLNLWVASVGVGGGIYATVEFNLNDPDGDGKVRIEEIIGNIQNGFKQLGIPLGLICIFDVSGSITARLFAFVKIKFLFFTWEKYWYFGPSAPLLEFSYSCPRDPILASINEGSGELRLNMGDYAKDRLYGDTTDGNEEFHVDWKSGDTVLVWAPGLGVGRGDAQEYSGVTKIIGDGGLGNDVIDLSGMDTGPDSITAELSGGSGNDVLIGVKGEASLYGGLGDDVLIGGQSDDELFGEKGNDYLIGSGGEDRLEGGLGNDVLNGDAQDTSTPIGPYQLRGSADDDILHGGEGDDFLAGGAGDDVIRGGGGKDHIWGDSSIKFIGSNYAFAPEPNGPGLPVILHEASGVDHITGDGDADNIDGEGGADFISGGGGPDYIDGGGGADKIWGDSSFRFNKTTYLLEINGTGYPVTIFPLYGTAGGDNISGGSGADEIYGEDGNDELFGDSGNDYIWGKRGSDVIYGGTDHDHLFGGTGNDRMFGNQGNDEVKGEADNDVLFGDDGEVYLVPHQLTINYDLIKTVRPGVTGNDIMNGDVGDDILLGGPGGDTMNGGHGDDRLVGDNGEFDFTWMPSMGGSLITLFRSTDLGAGGVDNIYGGEGDDIAIGGAAGDNIYGDSDAPGVDGEDVLIGDNGLVDFVPDANAKLSNITFINTTDKVLGTGGDDFLDGSENADIILGGVGNDEIIGGLEDDIILGDSGELNYNTGDGDLSTLDLIRTTDNILPAPGGTDEISGGEGNDTVLGGGADDTIYGDNTLTGNSSSPPGEDILLGDQGELVFENGLIARIETTAKDSADGGVDTIQGNEENDVIIGGVAGDNLDGNTEDDIIIGDEGLMRYNLANSSGGDGDPTTLDLINTTKPNLGSDDTIGGDEDEDIILGGSGADTIEGNEADDIILGDNGKLTMPGGVIDMIETIFPTYGSTDTIEGNDGDDIILGGTAADDIWGNDGADIILGDNGKITMPDEVIEVIETTDPTVGGSDTIEGNDGDDKILGGAEGDDIWGNNGEDVILGDNGRLDFVVDSDANTLDLIETTNATIGGIDTIEGNEDDDVILGGPYGDFIWGHEGDDLILGDSGRITQPGEIVERIETTNPTIGGSDTIYGNEGADYILGGAVGDDIWGNASDDVILGDNGFLDFVYDGDASSLDLIVSTDPGDGGSDTIEGNEDDDIILGGAEGDDIWGHGGHDIILGDNGNITQPGAVIQVIKTTAPAIGGSDTIEGNDGDDIILGGAYGDHLEGNAGLDIILGDNGMLDYAYPVDGSEPDKSTLDLIKATSPNDGGSDMILCGSGNDIAFGGTANDTMYGNEDNDLLFGDHARVERKPGMILDLNSLPVPTFTFISIFTAAADGGDGDLIHGNAGDDILLGQQGDDNMFGDEDDDDLIGGHNVVGGIDELDTPAGLNDIMDGGSGDDVLAGDNSIVLRRTDTVSPRFRALNGKTLYDANGNADVDPTHQEDPRGAKGRDITLLDHSDSPTSGTFGDDYMAGGPDDDVMFGQLGDDLMQGDASISEFINATDPSVEAGDDGDDYMEGNGGDDLMFGCYGQDDIIGGSSDQFGLTDSSMRPDGSDTIFGGAGTRIARYDPGDESDDGHAKDADYIIGDNGNIYRIVGTNGQGTGQFLAFTYDNYGNITIVPRAVQLLDYTAGGGASDIGDDDLIHGEAGDDVIHGLTGNDVIFGDAQDDDIFGQTGHDRLYGCNGEDGILGDDGKIFTSRNGEKETLYGLNNANKEKFIKMPGPFIGAWVHISGRLKKEADLYAFEYGGNDTIYGGLGDDWLHGGAGNDAISGAEALPEFYHDNPVTNFTPLPYDPVTRKFAAYDADFPLVKIDGFLLNFEAVDENGSKINDGKDRLFGDLGHDWLVGGTMNDRLFGGMGDDVLNGDDNHDSQGGLNNQPDEPEFADRDFIFGGGGLDVLIINTGGDRAFDWTGEFNSYIVPYSPFGYPEVNRLISPHAVKFLLALGEACGADQSLTEPDGELGLVTQKDPQWGDQHGAPRDPQAGNLPGVHRDTMGAPEDDREP
ncbi:MAG: DUF4347 domain-containing protein [Methanomassiliicoccales archaeon]|nr:MAG: DUF4347 domain-containing protein [Methanomassiliicoccales archaeon]